MQIINNSTQSKLTHKQVNKITKKKENKEQKEGRIILVMTLMSHVLTSGKELVAGETSLSRGGVFFCVCVVFTSCRWESSGFRITSDEA